MYQVEFFRARSSGVPTREDSGLGTHFSTVYLYATFVTKSIVDGCRYVTILHNHFLSLRYI